MATADSIWVSNLFSATVSRIDSATGRLIATIQVGGRPGVPVVAGDSLWVPNHQSGTVSRIGISSNEVLATIRVLAPIGPPAVFAGSIWVVSSLRQGTVIRIDPATNQVVESHPTGILPNSVTAAAESLWASNRVSDTITRIADRADS